MTSIYVCRFHKQSQRKGWKPGVRYHHAMRTESTVEFYKFMTAPQGGYASIDDYLKSISQIGRIQQLPVPVFSIHANDDPIHPGKRSIKIHKRFYNYLTSIKKYIF